jgi:hypothetical protein
MSRDTPRPEWSDVTAWQERERRRLSRAAEIREGITHYPADERWNLSDFRTVLAFEGENHTNLAKKEDLIRRHFKVSAVRYYQRLLQVLDMPEAMEHDPGMVYRLREQQSPGVRAGATK